MNIQLTQELINLATNLGIIDNISWDGGLTNLTYVERAISLGLEVPEEIVDFLREPPASSQVPEPNEPIEGYSKYIYTHLSDYKVLVGRPAYKFLVHGSYFTPSNELACDGFTITNVLFIDSHTLEVTADTTQSTGNTSYPLLIDGETVANMDILESTWVDYREGGDFIELYDTNAIDQNTQLVRDADGVGTTNAGDGWQKLLGITQYKLPLDHEDGCQVIVKKQSSGAAMFGFISDGHDVDGSMYNETIAGIYAQNQNTVWGFFSYASAARSTGISEYSRLKLRILGVVRPGATFELYGLTDEDDFDDGELLYSATIPNGTPDGGEYFYPCITPNNGVTIRLQAFNPQAN